MELENDIPPPPYSEVDPSLPPPTPDTSTMGGGDHSPTSTLRPTSSHSMRAPSFITLRGGWLRGVPFDEDPATADHFQGREFEFDPNRQLVVLHREITSDTTREDLPYPDIERNRDVSEQDWSTLVNYILTELGTETSVRHRKKLSAEEFYERQTKLEALISEWNEAFFQPRSIKFIAHYYHKAPRSPDSTRRSRRNDDPSGLRRIEVEDGPMENVATQQHHLGNTSPLNHHAGPFAHRRGFNRGGPFMRGGPRVSRDSYSRGGPGHPPFHTGGLLSSVLNFDRHGHGPTDRRGGDNRRRRSAEEHRHGRHHQHADLSDSSGSSDSSSSESDSDTEHRRGGRRGGRRGRRDCREHGNEGRRRRSHSVSSESSFSSVSSISSREMQEPVVGALREAIANFRLDPTNNAHNRVAYKQLLQEVRDQKKEALRSRQSGNTNDIRKASRVDRRAIRDDLRKLRSEAKQIARKVKRERKAARREEKKVRKEARKASRAAKKAGKRVMKNSTSQVPAGTSRDVNPGVASPGSYNIPGSFPDTGNETLVQQLESEVRFLEVEIQKLNEKAERETQGITHEEKRKLARATYDQEIKEIQDQVAALRGQILELGGTTTSSTSNGPQICRARSGPAATTLPGNQPPGYVTRAGQQGEAIGRYFENWGEQFGRDMEHWGENFGRQMERWGENFGRRMSERGTQLGQRFG